MIYREQLYNVKINKAKEENKTRSLFDVPLFSTQWFEGTDDQGRT